MLRIIWRFRTKEKRVDEFRNVYGWKGKWAKLFGRSPEYQGTILLQDVSDPSRIYRHRSLGFGRRVHPVPATVSTRLRKPRPTMQ